MSAPFAYTLVVPRKSQMTRRTERKHNNCAILFSWLRDRRFRDVCRRRLVHEISNARSIDGGRTSRDRSIARFTRACFFFFILEVFEELQRLHDNDTANRTARWLFVAFLARLSASSDVEHRVPLLLLLLSTAFSVPRARAHWDSAENRFYANCLNKIKK